MIVLQLNEAKDGKTFSTREDMEVHNSNLNSEAMTNLHDIVSNYVSDSYFDDIMHMLLNFKEEIIENLSILNRS